MKLSMMIYDLASMLGIINKAIASGEPSSTIGNGIFSLSQLLDSSFCGNLFVSDLQSSKRGFQLTLSFINAVLMSSKDSRRVLLPTQPGINAMVAIVATRHKRSSAFDAKV